jgi:hypothetical protein
MTLCYIDMPINICIGVSINESHTQALLEGGYTKLHINCTYRV